MEKRKEEFECYLSSTPLKILLLLASLVLQIVVIIALNVQLVDRTTTTTTTTTAATTTTTTTTIATAATNRIVEVLKCCESDETFNVNDTLCENANTSSELKVPKYVNENGTHGEYERGELRLVHRGDMNCTDDDVYLLNPAIEETDTFVVSGTGWLTKENVVGHRVQPGQFCIERLDSATVACVCSPGPDIITHYYVIGMVASIIFLICTFLVYAIVDKFRNLHGKSLMCQTATLSAGYAGTLAISYYKPGGPDALCTVLAYTTQFSYLACFYWLNVMCFDLWWTFSGRRSNVRNSKQHESKNFKIYSVYAWGCSLLISAITCCVQFYPFAASSGVHNPKLGQGDLCWFQNGDRVSTNSYFYGPITTLVLCNLVMFVHTTMIIVRQTMKIKDLKRNCENERNNQNDTLRFMLYLKLFFVMGVSWLAEMLAWYFKEESQEEDFVWYFFNVMNALRGLLIFLIYVCKKDVLIVLNQKVCPKYVLYKQSTRTTENNTRDHLKSQKR